MPIWFEDPSVLFKKSEITKLWPQPGTSVESKINAISRLVVLLTAVGVVVMPDWEKLVVAMVVSLAALAVYYKHSVKKVGNAPYEAITNMGGVKNGANVIQPSVYNPKNPLNNVLLPEMGTDIADREPVYSSEPVVQAVQSNSIGMMDPASGAEADSIKNRLFRSLGDSFTVDNSMRSYYSVPNRGVVGDQSAFVEYCYGDMTSVKENGVHPI